MVTRNVHLRRASFLCLALSLSCTVAVEASARTPKQARESPAVDSIELELRELGGEERSVEFVVPLDGRIAGWTELYGERQYCRLDADRVSDDRIELHMRCGKGREPAKLDLEFKAVRSFESGKPMLLAEFTPNATHRVQLVATRH